MGRKQMREIRNCGYSVHVGLILFGFERSWEDTSRKASQALERRLLSKMRKQWKFLERRIEGSPPPVFLETGPEEISPDENNINENPDDDLLNPRLIERIRKITTGTLDSTGTAKARLVVFEEPGTYVYLPPHGRVISLSRAMEAAAINPPNGARDESSNRAERLLTCTVGDINAGDLLAFPKDSKTDLLDDFADRSLATPNETRRIAGLWREALRGYADSKHLSPLEIQKELQVSGLKRHPVTIRGWMMEESIVAPQDYQEAIRVIEKITENEELSTNNNEVCQAIDLIYRARARAANDLLKHLSDRTIDVEEGEVTVQIRGHTIHYRILRVSNIDPEIEVSKDIIGVLKNVTEVTFENELADTNQIDQRNHPISPIN